MLTYKGGNQAKGGFYLNKAEWEMVTVEGKDGMLPGGAECEYIKVPGILLVPVAVALGGLFVVFLPFIGFAMLFTMIAVKAARGIAVLGQALAENLAQWQPLRMPVVAFPAILTLAATKTGLGGLTRALAEKLTGLRRQHGHIVR